MRFRLLLLWVSPAVLGAFLMGLVTARAVQTHDELTYWNDTINERVRLLVGSEYVDEISEERGRELFYAAMEGYLRALDDYCTFYDPLERESMEVDTRGRFGGVGILVRQTEDGLRIVGLRKGDPAQKAGVQLGDLIVSVAGVETADLPLEDVTHLIRGDPGDPVTVGLLRGGETFSLELIRSQIKVDSVVGVRLVDPEKGIGYLRIVSFQENTGEDAREALRYLQEAGATSFVLDLRQNTGGVLEKGAVALADLFFGDGPIVQTQGRTRESRKVYEASAATTVAATEPVVILLDGGSASAAEVVAGAFQDRRRGILVGQRSYGKFMVQSIHPLPDQDVALQLTTARYFTPYGRWLQRRESEDIRGGLIPDVVVQRTKEDSEHLARSFQRHHGLDMIVEKTAAEEHPDPQLDRAVSILADYAVIKSAKKGD